MGLFDRFTKTNKSSDYKAKLAIAIKHLCEEEGLPWNEDWILSICDMPRFKTFKCDGTCPVLIYIGDSFPTLCPTCGRRLKPLDTESQSLPLTEPFKSFVLSQAHYNASFYYINKQEYEHALVELSRTIELNPMLTDAYYNRAEIKLRMNDYTGAIDDCTVVLASNPNDAAAYYNRGSAKAQLGNTKEAVEDFTKALSCGYSDPRVYFSLGFLNAQLGKTTEAISKLNKYLELSPNSPQAAMARIILGDIIE